MREEKLAELLEGLPRSPGVYLMKDAKGKIIYVGKAKNLASRVRSYFASGSSDRRFIRVNIRRLVSDIEIVLTASEKEALLLESSLIKLHSPRYNVLLRDDKDFLCLRLDRSHKWPKIEVVRRPKKDGADYFGPYHNASAARETLRLVRRHFKIRSCKDSQMVGRVRPCLQNQIHRCLGPCVLDVDHDDYLDQIHYARLFLLGRLEELVTSLKSGMDEAAQEFAYERAAVLRDQIKAVEATLAPQRVVTPFGIDQDIIGLHRVGDQVQIIILEVREGRLKEKLEFYFAGQEFPDGEILSSFVVQRYRDGVAIPGEIVVSKPLDHATALAEILSERSGKKIQLINPKRGSRVEQAAMADLNAEQLLKSRLKDKSSIENRLGAVQRRLRLPVPPRRIECVDISHLGGENTVGAVGVVVDGQIERSLGRTYKINTPTKGDDYAAMTEVLTRRFIRAQKREKGWEAPDLLVVDGGRGQLSVASAVLSDLGIDSQSVVALAKERSDGEDKQSDRVYIPGRKNPILLKARVSPLYMLAMARDEAHNLAVRFQRKVRQKKTIGSELDVIPGVGLKLRARMLKKLGSVKRIRESSIEELAEVPGIGEALAKKIKEFLT